MKKTQFLVIGLVVFGSFLFFVNLGNAASTCSLSFSSPHGSYIAVGDKVIWTLNSSFSGGKSYWFGTKNGVTDVSAIDTTFGNPFSWTTDPYPSDTVGNYTRWVQINDVNGNFLCQTPLVYASVVNPPPTASLSVTPSTVTAGQSLTYLWSSSTNAVSWAWTLNIFKTSDLSHTVSTDGCGNSTGNWTGPSGGNSISGSSSAPTASCQAGYTYNIMYSAYTEPNQSGQAASAQTTVIVNAPATSSPTIIVSSPNGGTFYLGQTITISWSRSGSTSQTSTITPFILENGQNNYPWGLCSPMPATSGSCNWTIPNNFSTGNSFRIKVQEAPSGGGLPLASSTGSLFTISTPISTTTPTPSPTPAPTPMPTPIPTPTPATTPTPADFTINSCQEITQPGNYTLSGNITGSPRTYCLNIHDVNNINLDCAGHSIKSDINSSGNLEDSAVRIKNVRNFSVKNCYLSNVNIPNQYFPKPIEIRNSSSGLINNNTFGDSTSKVSYSVVTYSDNINFSNNKFNSSYIEFLNTTNSAANNNAFNYKPSTVISALISFGDGNNNTITNNNIDGGSDGVPANKYGPDDGIILQNENNDTVLSNTIKNVWDAGIETLGIIKNTTINNNYMYNTGITAIGAWYGNNWQGNTVSGNTGERVNLLLNFFRRWGLQAGESSFNFENNTFDNNRLINPNSAAFYSARFDLDYRFITYDIPSDPIINAGNTKVGNNKFTNNNFGSTLLAPLFIPISAIVDGGNNICKPGTDNSYPLACGRPGSSAPTPSLTPTTTVTPTPIPTSTPVPTPFPTPTPGPIDQNHIYSLSEIYDGDLIRGQGDIAVWIVRIVGEKRYKRWLFGPQIFTAYGHLSFAKVKNINKITLNNFDTSNLIRKDGDAKVYELTDFVPGVRAVRRWIPTLEVFLQRGFDFDSVYIVNEREFNLYTEGSPLPLTQSKPSEPSNKTGLTANISEAMFRFLGRTKNP